MPIKVLHVTTHDEECGIAKYQEQFLEAMKPLSDVINTIFEYSPNRTKVMSSEEFAPVLQQFASQMADYDVLHVQHEFSFYSGSELDQIVSEAKRQGKPVIITVHTALDAGFPTFSLRELRRVRTLFGKTRLSQQLTQTHVVPMKKADLVLTHNSIVSRSLMKRGVKKGRIQQIIMPVPKISFEPKSQLISNRLHKQTGDVIVCTVGFLSENKGMKEAVRALEQLPPNYKLALIGGSHPSGANDAFIQELQQLIKDRRLAKRAFITGYIEDDSELNALIRECEVCVYPYSKQYYAGVTSAALNNALANHKPVIAYPTASIREMNSIMPAVVICDNFDYHELADKLLHTDLTAQAAVSRRYAEAFSYPSEAKNLADIYKQVQ